jgi:hypothetical protein
MRSCCCLSVRVACLSSHAGRTQTYCEEDMEELKDCTRRGPEYQVAKKWLLPCVKQAMCQGMSMAGNLGASTQPWHASPRLTK